MNVRCPRPSVVWQQPLPIGDSREEEGGLRVIYKGPLVALRYFSPFLGTSGAQWGGCRAF